MTTTTELQTFKIMGISDMQNRYNDFAEFSKSILKEKLDYGTIPWISKPSLFKPWAEKLRVAYGLGVEITRTGEMLNLESDFYDVNYLATIKDRNGNIIAQCEGSANTNEDKYRYTWIPGEKPATKEEEDKLKALKQGKWSKPNGTWQWMQKAEASNRISLKNTIQKMAQKRAFVGAILMATGASEFFTQDVEDMNIWGNTEIIETKEEKNQTSDSVHTPPLSTTSSNDKPRFNKPQFEELAEKKNFINSFTSAEELISEVEKTYKISGAMKDEIIDLWSDTYVPFKVSEETEEEKKAACGLPF